MWEKERIFRVAMKKCWIFVGELLEHPEMNITCCHIKHYILYVCSFYYF